MALTTTRMFKAKDEKRLRVAAHHAGVNVKDVVYIGEDMTVELTYRHTDTLIKLGEYFGKVTGNEIIPKKFDKDSKTSKQKK